MTARTCIFFLLLSIAAPVCASAPPSFKRAMGFYDKGRYRQAGRELIRLVRRDRRNALYWFNLATVYYNLKRFPDAARSFKNVIRLKSRVATAAWFYLAETYDRMGKRRAAYRIRRWLLRSNDTPDWMKPPLIARTTVTLGRAVAAYDRQDYEQTVSITNMALKKKNRADALVLKGLALMKLRQLAAARNAFRRALRAPGKGETRAHARFLLDQLESRAGAKPFWLYLDAGFGYNTNVFLDGASESPAGNSMAQFLAGFGYQLLKTEPYLVRIGYSAYWEETPGQEFGRYHNHTLKADLGYEGKDWRLRLSPSLLYQFLGPDPFLLTPRVEALAQRNFDRFEAGLAYRLGKNFSQGTGYTYLDGSSHLGSIYGTFRGQAYRLTFQYRLGRESTGDLVFGGVTLPFANTYHGPQLSIRWFPGRLWEVEASATVSFKNYGTLAQPGNLERSDTTISGDVRGYYQVAEGLRVFGAFTLLNNSSTIGAGSGVDDKDYTQVLGITGVSWDILR